MRSLLRQEALPAITPLAPLKTNLSRLHSETCRVLGNEIKPTKPIQDLLDDALLQAWAKQGIPLHREKREICGFCGNPLPPDLWYKLDQHFSKESQELDKELTELLAKIEAEAVRIKTIVPFEKAALYPTLHNQFVEIAEEIQKHEKEYLAELKWMKDEVKSRQADPFKAREVGDLGDSEVTLMKAFGKLEPLLEQQSEKTESLAIEQYAAQTRLRLSAVSNFIAAIDLPKTDKEIATLSSEVIALQGEVTTAKTAVSTEEAAIENLRKQLRDERRGAEKVNDLLTHYFGHGSLKLVAVDVPVVAAIGVRFEIQRSNQKAYNLSDGECSLIAFCYFMAKLQGIDSNGKDLIIYIDDPISSLDSDHIFFAFSLIEGLIASHSVDAHGNKADRYKQLFISTHNLDFLKFLKRLSRPQVGGNEHFVVVRTENGSLVELMPFYLRHYVTEFHYLFDQICACVDAANISGGHHCFFSFGNNLRKFLEIYLFFKFPFCENSSGDYNKRIVRFFNDDPATEPMVMRISNELSHGGEVFDRSIRPVEYAEISKMAGFILRKVKAQDSVQYSDLLQATGRSDPLQIDAVQYSDPE